eukprot:CAMPEP_0176269086 /NCGR_PEP_ID=MMETSP0121_2-20121125/44012_1 /TAXON_ID=160619 /ORGANISM="Kryptoperidinium foliaceum, Strain CCMP 1326" /LENGTH=54 /DNA_ID=CAMNT_0017609207 /DNA_START=107 /DNA_END=268 /DNA_ORIENTATION=-
MEGCGVGETRAALHRQLRALRRGRQRLARALASQTALGSRGSGSSGTSGNLQVI